MSAKRKVCTSAKIYTTTLKHYANKTTRNPSPILHPLLLHLPGSYDARVHERG